MPQYLNSYQKISLVLRIGVYSLLLSNVAFASIAIKDARGVEVLLSAPAQRVVSMLPSLTESVCALG